MLYHQRVMTCRKSGGPLSQSCECAHCTFSICKICGGVGTLRDGVLQGTLTTDCPGLRIDKDRLTELAETSLDWTYVRGWHLATDLRLPQFETEIPPTPPSTDPRAIVAPGIDWARVDRTTDLYRELGKKAVEWVMADRKCEDRSAALARVQDEAEALRGKTRLTDPEKALHAKLEREKIDFHLASDRAERCRDEFEQMARRLVEALEDGPLTKPSDNSLDEMRERYMPKDLGPPE